MKYVLSWSHVVLGCLFPLCAHAGTPQVRLYYAEMFDFVCGQQTKYQIDQKWVSELDSRLPEFRTLWQGAGPTLLQTSADVVGKSFDQTEFAVNFSVCSFPSMSDPLLINMRYSLKSFTAAPIGPNVTVSIIYHEILHQYLKGKIPRASKLLAKYAGEGDTVLSHLHLFALQKAVYLKLNQPQTLNDVIKKDQSLPNKAYARTWEIVNTLEDYTSFITELRN